jgi:hypothetical protein
MKTKNPGISLLISFLGSFFILGVTISVLASISRSLENTQNLERSNQFFYAAESGLEAAFYHHNARGPGSEFPTISPPQSIDHSTIGTTTVWTIDSQSNQILGLLKENQSLQIPLNWDDGITPTTTPNENGRINAQGIHLHFYPTITNSETDPIKIALYNQYGTFSVPLLFDWGDNGAPQVLIDWSVSRETIATGVIETFIPDQGNGGACSPGTEFLCEDSFSTEFEVDIGDSGIAGTILPGNIAGTLGSPFVVDNAAYKYKITIRSLLPYSDSDSTNRIIGIPFAIEDVNTNDFPDTEYTITTQVDSGDFSKTISVTIPEKTTIGAFDYIVFD